MIKTKKILLITSVFVPEPITSAKMNYDLATKLTDKYDVTVLTPYPSRPEGYNYENFREAKVQFRIIRLKSFICPKSKLLGRFRESYSFGAKCADYIKHHAKEIDFVYNDGWQLFGLYEVAKACVYHNIPYMVPIQDIYPESLLTKLPKVPLLQNIVKALLSPIDRYYIKHAACVRTISEGMVNYLSDSRNIPLKQFLPVANWQNDDDYKHIAKKRELNEPIKFMFLGNNNAQANVDLIIRGFIEANISNSELYIMGQGSAKKYCMGLAQASGNKNIFFDVVPEGMTSEVQSKADVMVLALKKGTGTLGIPSKLTSYMLSGKPVIASVELDSDTANIVSQSNSGIVIEPDDIKALANAYVRMSAMDNTKLDSMGNNSYQYAISKLSKKGNLALVCSTIEKIINQNER